MPIRSGDPLSTGSLGAGILIQPGIFGEGLGGGCGVVVNGECVEIKLARVIGGEGALGSGVDVRSSIPLGMGGAVSAFISLALSCEAIEGRLGSCLTREGLLEASRLAHRAEVLSLTGLGDVIAMVTGGGLVLRLRAGAPGFGEAVAIRDPELGVVLFTIASIERGITTPDMLSTMWDRIVSVGLEVYREFQRDPGLVRFLEMSNRFSRAVGFLSGGFGDAIDRSLAPLVRRGSVLGYYAKKSLLVIAHERGVEEEVSGSIGGFVKKVLGIYRSAEGGFEAFGDMGSAGSS